ncbi:hypothetical protein RFI_31192 [Reticulomyxa filosa]|uniref:Uncharacterized protein n=1 Tax=Reticulomyxa filosa TaxID=46433 RepID=X6LZN7_RETFI|nr:hypothetical protein RFI_31192 [Reticulomyxa filosa]|eukprot:ETO06205.1 hypothetical protein RFI_31192 [Reticulomyxa filosa]
MKVKVKRYESKRQNYAQDTFGNKQLVITLNSAWMMICAFRNRMIILQVVVWTTMCLFSETDENLNQKFSFFLKKLMFLKVLKKKGGGQKKNKKLMLTFFLNFKKKKELEKFDFPVEMAHLYCGTSKTKLQKAYILITQIGYNKIFSVQKNFKKNSKKQKKTPESILQHHLIKKSRIKRKKLSKMEEEKSKDNAKLDLKSITE